VLILQPDQPAVLLGAVELRLGSLGQHQEEAGMPLPHAVAPAAFRSRSVAYWRTVSSIR